MDIIFLILSKNIFPVFPAKSNQIIHNINVAKLQILIALGFVVMEYKIQVVIFRIIVLELYKNTNSEDKSLNKRFCSTYIQLLHL